MSQSAVILPGSPLTGAAAAADINAAWAAIISQFSGNSAPTLGPGAAGALVEGQYWLDTSVNPNMLRQWDGTTWCAVETIDATAHAVTVQNAIGALISIVTYSGTQTVTIPVGAIKAFVQLWAPTGGSGGVSNGASGGSGAGGYLEKYLTGLTPGNTLAYSEGSAGGAGAATPTAGGNAGNSTLSSGTQSISTLTVNGSTGSNAASASSGTGTPGGTSSGGDINITGQRGVFGSVAATQGGAEGCTFFSLGARGVYNAATSAGNAGNAGGMKISWYR